MFPFLPILLLLSSLLHAAPTSLRQPDSATIYDVIFTSSQPPAFDNNGKDMDILLALISRTSFQQILSQSTPDGITFLAPNDDAFRQSAQDLGFNPSSEQQTYSIFDQLLTKLYPDDLQAGITDLLKYHTGIVEMASDRIGADQPFITFTGDQITLVGNTLEDGYPNFPNPSIVFSFADVQASNGIIHTIDRVLFRNPVPSLDSVENPTSTPPSVAPTTTTTTTPITPSTVSDSDGFDPELNPDEPSGTPSPTTVPSTSTSPPTTSPSTTTTVSTTVSTSPSPETASDDPACFPASSVVHLADGSDLKLSHLSAGHNVLVSETMKSQVYLFTHKRMSGMYKFVRIRTDDHVVTLSEGHYLYANGRLETADKVRTGDMLRTLDGGARVKDVEVVMEEGLVAPHTLHGDIVVDRVVVSTYTRAVDPRLAHVILSPVRMLTKLGIVEPLGGMFYDGRRRILDW